MSYIKLVLVGDACVGKSALCIRYSQDKFPIQYTMTIGVEFVTKFIGNPLQKKDIRLNIWDTAGNERFRTITASYFRGASIIGLCYDCSNSTSFHQLKNWLQLIDKHVDRDIPRVLICCKADTPEFQREIESGVAREYATALRMQFVECSALTAEGCDAVFECIVRTALSSNERSL